MGLAGMISGGAAGAMANAPASAVWTRTSQVLKHELGEATFGSWLGQASLREMGDEVCLVAATGVARDWIRRHAWRRIGELWAQHVTFTGSGAGQFLYVIFGLHALHVIGGVIVLLVMFIKAFLGKTKLYSSVPVEVAATYWHFVDFLWIYLLVFLVLIK